MEQNVRNSPFNPGVISSIELPNTRRYEFFYNEYGEAARVELPTGGATEYDYTPRDFRVVSNGPGSQIYRRVTEQRVYTNGNALESRTTFVPDYPCCPEDKLTDVMIDQYDASGTRQSRTKHYYYGDPVWGYQGQPTGIWHPHYLEGKEYRTEVIDPGNGTTVLRRVEQTWMQRAPLNAHDYNGGSAFNVEPPNDPRLIETTTTLADVSPNLVTKRTAVNPQTGAVGFDQYNNPLMFTSMTTAQALRLPTTHVTRTPTI